MSEQVSLSTETQVPDLGGALKRAREEQGLELATVAAKLRVAKQKLEYLEANEFEKVGPSIFVKGYVKSYSKLLNLDYQSLMQDFPDDEADQTEALMQSFSRRTEQEAHDNRLMFVSYIILAIIIGSSALWWWQSSDKSLSFGASTDNQQAPLQSDSAKQSAEQAKAEQPQIQGLEDQDMVALEQEPQTIEPAVQQPTQSDSEEQTGQQEADAQLGEQLANTEVEQVPTVEQAQTGQSNDDAAQATTTLSAQEELEEPLAAGEQEVEMRFTAQSWVEVNDAEGERLVYDIKEPGEHITLVGKAPFSVILGKHDVVAITVNGEAVDISHFPKNRLAKFTLPLTE